MSRFDREAVRPGSSGQRDQAPYKVCRLLSGYLSGTHSGLLGRTKSGARRADSVEAIAAAHRAVAAADDSGDAPGIGYAQWVPEEQSELAASLQRAFSHPHVVDLVFYGSQARGGRTGFSDVDAILVITDEAADNPTALRSLRPIVVAAQRAVLRHQPMQHHGFDVATPRLLTRVAEALRLPAVALSDTRSLHGKGVRARLLEYTPWAGEALLKVARTLSGVGRWPSHPWQVHGVVSMFELLPTLYLQAVGSSVPKSRSFAVARGHFDVQWWPYDVLEVVRQRWPRQRYLQLERAITVLQNPWAGVALWRRLPESAPEEVQPLLSRELLAGLQTLRGRMVEQVQ